MSTELTAAHYDRVTEAWRLVMGEAFHYGVFAGTEGDNPTKALDRATTRLNEVMLAAAAPLPFGAFVLDVGCGIGGPARWLARTARVRVRGLSNSATGVAEATRLSAAEGLHDVTDFAVADAMHNQQDGGVFDLVWVMESSHLMPDKPQLLRECARVLKPGGRLVLCDLLVKQPFSMEEVFSLRKDLRHLDRAFGRAKMETEDFYTEHCGAAGLDVVATQDLTAATRPTLVAWAQNAETHREQLAARIGAGGVSDLQRACEVLQGFWDSGRMGYGLLQAVKSS